MTMAVAMASTFAFAAEPVATPAPTPTVEAKTVDTVKSQSPRKERKPMTPEQFAEFKTKHLNMLNNRAKILEGETTCANSAQSMKDMKVCFKTAMEARKELGIHKKKHHNKPRHSHKGADGEKRHQDKVKDVKAVEPVAEAK